MVDIPLALPRSLSVEEFYSFSSQILHTLGIEFGKYVDQNNKERRGTDWFQLYCDNVKYVPNLYDPEFLLKEPDSPNSWCRWCLPQDNNFHLTRRRIKNFRNRWAHFEKVQPEDLASFLSDLQQFAVQLGLPMSKFLPRIQEHIRYLVDNPDLVLSDESLKELHDEIHLLKEENSSLKDQLASFDKWFPTLTSFSPESSTNSNETHVCLHFKYDGHGHNVKAQKVKGSTGLAEIQFQLPMEIPLGEGDVVAYKGLPSSYCVSVTAIISRREVFRIQIMIDYGKNGIDFFLLAHLSGHLSEEERAEILDEVGSKPDGPFERRSKFLEGFVELLGDLNKKCAVIEDSVLLGSIVVEITSLEHVQPVIEAAQLQDHGDAWLLSSPTSPMGSLSELDRFGYAVGSDRLTAEAIRLGWFVDPDKSMPDLNRVIAEYYWEPVSDLFIKRH